MTIKPVVKTVTVKASPERAFEAFTANMGQWWPKTHTIGAAPFEAVVMEPRVGGRWYERAADGAETNWGKVLAWDPPRRFVLAWQISADWAYDPNLMTEVEVSVRGQGRRDDRRGPRAPAPRAVRRARPGHGRRLRRRLGRRHPAALSISWAPERLNQDNRTERPT